jgi:hypothetical protein
MFIHMYAHTHDDAHTHTHTITHVQDVTKKNFMSSSKKTLVLCNDCLLVCHAEGGGMQLKCVYKLDKLEVKATKVHT